MVRLALLVCLLFALRPGSASAAEAHAAGFEGWRSTAGDFASWERVGVELTADGSLRLDPSSAAEDDGTLLGEATGPVHETPFAFRELVASWNVETPRRGWIEVLARARVDGSWTRWYSLGIWSSDPATQLRRSIRAQRDADGRVDVDTLKLNGDADAAQLSLRLFSWGSEPPVVRAASIAFSTEPTARRRTSAGDRRLWNRSLDLPRCSQMVYPNGGRVWCSPTSTSMILAYWAGSDGPCAPDVRAAVDGVYDWSFRGHGNWSFNAAYAATQGLEAHVLRLTGLDEAETWIAAGVPLAFSFAFGPGELPGAPLNSVNGHLAVLVGFDARGNPIVHDPAAPSDDAVRRVYPRRALERLWLEHSAGTVYAIYPPGWDVPTR